MGRTCLAWLFRPHQHLKAWLARPHLGRTLRSDNARSSKLLLYQAKQSMHRTAQHAKTYSPAVVPVQCRAKPGSHQCAAAAHTGCWSEKASRQLIHTAHSMRSRSYPPQHLRSSRQGRPSHTSTLTQDFESADDQDSDTDTDTDIDTDTGFRESTAAPQAYDTMTVRGRTVFFECPLRAPGVRPKCLAGELR